MPINQLQILNQYAYATVTEILAQQVQLFNAATRGAITLQSGSHQGSFSDVVSWAAMSLVRRRNQFGSGSVSEIEMRQLLDTAVKVASGTPPVRIDPSMFNWIMRSPDEAGVVIGQQLAPAMLGDMLNTAITAYIAAHSQVAAVVHSTPAAGPSFLALNEGASKFGDRSQALVVWVMHSAIAHKLYANALTNGQNLFEFGSTAVRQDPFNRVFIISDSSAMIDPEAGDANADMYYTLGMVPGAIAAMPNADFVANIETSNGLENIKRTYQAEWTFQLGVKGFSWDKGSGGASPDDAAIGSSASWDQYATSHKDIGGVLVKTTL